MFILQPALIVQSCRLVNVDLIVNRQAHRLGARSKLRDVLARAAASAGARVHETYSLDELERVAREVADRGTDAVVLAGGDGSHMGGLSALGRAFGGALPPVALAPGGTVCTVARNLGMRGRAHTWAENAVRAACTGGGRLEEHATLRVTDDAGGDRVGFIFGAGLVAGFFDEYYAGSGQGIVSAAGIAARVFAGSLAGSPFARRVLAPAACTLEVDGVTQGARAWSLVLASVVPDVGLHVRATYRARERRGTFHAVASVLPPRGLAFEVPRVLTGRAMHGEPRVDALATSLRVVFDERAAYVLDGDLMRAHDVLVTPGPTLRLIVP
jgi:diacylglycerol kinase (ATP)